MKKTPAQKNAIKPKPKLTDAERHKRFVDMAHEVGADESSESFDQAFDKVVSPKPKEDHPRPSEPPASS
jgi:hypothetical protein